MDINKSQKSILLIILILLLIVVIAGPYIIYMTDQHTSFRPLFYSKEKSSQGEFVSVVDSENFSNINIKYEVVLSKPPIFSKSPYSFEFSLVENKSFPNFDKSNHFLVYKNHKDGSEEIIEFNGSTTSDIFEFTYHGKYLEIKTDVPKEMNGRYLHKIYGNLYMENDEPKTVLSGYGYVKDGDIVVAQLFSKL